MVFQVVLRGFQGYLKGVYKVCQGSFNGVSGSFEEVSRMFQECLKKVTGLFQNSFKGEGRLKAISRQISVGFKGI